MRIDAQRHKDIFQREQEMKKVIFIFLIVLCMACCSFAQPPEWVELPEHAAGRNKFYHSNQLDKHRWRGFPDPNYVWEGERLSWEREVIDEHGNPKTVKTWKEPIEIIAKFKPETKIYSFDKQGKIERAAVEKFGGSLKWFIWIENVDGGGKVIMPDTAPNIFIARGDRLNPVLTKIGTDTSADNYYSTFEGKTHCFVSSFSGLGGVSDPPATLVAHYKMNDDTNTAVVVDETGNHNGEYQLNSVAQNTDTGASTGKINGALDFVGGANGEHIEIADHADFSPVLTPFSISAWVYMHGALDFIIATKDAHLNHEWQFILGGDDLLYGRFIDDSTGGYIGRYSGSTLTAYENQWIHLVLTYDGGTLISGIKLYLNSVRNDEQTWESGSFTAVENRNNPVWIGYDGTNFADGLIDNLTIFSIELDQSDVNFLYSGGQGREDWVRYLMAKNN